MSSSPLSERDKTMPAGKICRYVPSPHLLYYMLSLYLITLLIRWIPLFFSPLPYNIDGFSMAGVSDNIILSGHWIIGSPMRGVDYNSKTPFFPIILAEFSLVTGISPLYVEQYMLPFLTATIPPFIFFFCYRFTGNTYVSFFAALFLSFNGLFSFLTGSIMKEALGLLLLPVALYFYLERNDDIRKRLLLSSILIFITMLHYRSTLMLYIFLLLLLSWDWISLFKTSRLSLRSFLADFFSIPLLGIFSFFYYMNVRMEDYYKQAFNINEMFLFVCVAFVWFLLYLRFMSRSQWIRKKSILPYLLDWKFLIFMIFLAAFLVNSQRRIFAGTIMTSTALIQSAVPYVALIALALFGFSVLQRYKSDYLHLVTAIYVGTFIPITYSVVRGLDVFSQEILYRSYNFMDFGTAILLGVALAYIIMTLRRTSWKGLGVRSRISIAASLLLVVSLLLASSVPLGYDTVQLFGVQNITYQYEVDAIDWVKEVNCSTVGTDQRLGDIMASYNDVGTTRSVPWSLANDRSVKARFVMLETSWSTWGAQMYPSPPLVLEQATIGDLLHNNSLIYSSGYSNSPEGQVYVVLLG